MRSTVGMQRSTPKKFLRIASGPLLSLVLVLEYAIHWRPYSVETFQLIE